MQKTQVISMYVNYYIMSGGGVGFSGRAGIGLTVTSSVANVCVSAAVEWAWPLPTRHY